MALLATVGTALCLGIVASAVTNASLLGNVLLLRLEPPTLEDSQDLITHTLGALFEKRKDLSITMPIAICRRSMPVASDNAAPRTWVEPVE